MGGAYQTSFSGFSFLSAGGGDPGGIRVASSLKATENKRRSVEEVRPLRQILMGRKAKGILVGCRKDRGWWWSGHV